VFTATRPFYNGKALFAYNRTATAAFIDTLYIPMSDSTSTGCDSTCAVSILRESAQWVVGGGANFTGKHPTITWIANPSKSGAKVNWLSISFPAGDTLVSKLRIEKPFR
jgi:hypothetical protein